MEVRRRRGFLLLVDVDVGVDVKHHETRPKRADARAEAGRVLATTVGTLTTYFRTMISTLELILLYSTRLKYEYSGQFPTMLGVNHLVLIRRTEEWAQLLVTNYQDTN